MRTLNSSSKQRYILRTTLNGQNNRSLCQWRRGIIFIGVSDEGEAFGISLKEVDEYKNLIAVVNDRNIFPHIKYHISMRSVDDEANRFVLVLKIDKSDSIVRYRDGDFNEKVYVKGDGNSTPATPEEIISLSGRKFGIDNHFTDIDFDATSWMKYMEWNCVELTEPIIHLHLLRNFRMRKLCHRMVRFLMVF